MKNIIRIISILLGVIASNNLNAALGLELTPVEPCNYKVCTVHDEIYEVIVGQGACSGELPGELPKELPGGFEGPAGFGNIYPYVHEHINAHDPECFSFHCSAEAPVYIKTLVE